jgi:glycosyltransferase involved in cell wall biosynthesis
MSAITTTVRVSVCMPTYNGEAFIASQLRSILVQLGPDDEVVISDDGSSDRTIDIIGQIRDPKVRVFAPNKYRSPIYNMENALRQARGAFIFLADQDDVWLEGKIAKMLTALEQCELVACDAQVVDQDLGLLHSSYLSWAKVRPGFLNCLMKNYYIGCCMAFRRSLLDRALPFPSKLPMHDWWLGLLAEKTGTACLLREPLVMFRRHSGTASTSFRTSTRPWFQRLSDRVRLFYWISKRSSPQRLAF